MLLLLAEFNIPFGLSGLLCERNFCRKLLCLIDLAQLCENVYLLHRNGHQFCLLL
jgi:hypothetical protein